MLFLLKTQISANQNDVHYRDKLMHVQRQKSDNGRTLEINDCYAMDNHMYFTKASEYLQFIKMD